MDDQLLAPVDVQLATIAAERERIAGELHDDSIQAMTAVSLHLQRLAARLEGEADLALVGEIRAATDEAIDRLRHMLFVLHPATLEEDGLTVSLEVYLETYVEPLGIAWTLEGDQDPDIPIGVAALGFRLARESVSNAVRHAAPQRIGVTVVMVDGSLVLTVTDDGTGFDVGEARRRVGHLGLDHSRALAEAALGSHQVTSEYAKGTVVVITLPVGA